MDMVFKTEKITLEYLVLPQHVFLFWSSSCIQVKSQSHTKKLATEFVFYISTIYKLQSFHFYFLAFTRQPQDAGESRRLCRSSLGKHHTHRLIPQHDLQEYEPGSVCTRRMLFFCHQTWSACVQHSHRPLSGNLSLLLSSFWMKSHLWAGPTDQVKSPGARNASSASQALSCCTRWRRCWCRHQRQSLSGSASTCVTSSSSVVASHLVSSVNTTHVLVTLYNLTTVEHGTISLSCWSRSHCGTLVDNRFTSLLSCQTLASIPSFWNTKCCPFPVFCDTSLPQEGQHGLCALSHTHMSSVVKVLSWEPQKNFLCQSTGGGIYPGSVLPASWQHHVPALSLYHLVCLFVWLLNV